MFDALSKLSASIPDTYQRASEFGDLHLGDLHLIRVYEDSDEPEMDSNRPQWVALAIVRSYNPRRKVPRGKISIPNLKVAYRKHHFQLLKILLQSTCHVLAHQKVISFIGTIATPKQWVRQDEAKLTAQEAALSVPISQLSNDNFTQENM
ncbi:hypothetical protein FF1_019304 [Malus domestica]